MAANSKSNTHKKQHFVPQCYLKAWLDPESKGKEKLDPYVWVFDKDGANGRRKSPGNLFTEQDIYTIPGADGQRDLRLEHGFQQLEDLFTRIRNLTLNRRKWPDAEQMASLLAFVATAQARTKANRDHHRAQWAEMRQRMEKLQTAIDSATPEQRKAFAAAAHPTSSEKGGGITLEHVKRLEEMPIQEMIAPVVSTVLSCFARMHVAVLCTDDPLGFVTSDHPCTWFDPEAYKMPPIYRGTGLGSPTIEVTLPISPRQCLLITHNKAWSGFNDVKEHVVDSLNHRHIGHCDQSFVAQSATTKAAWFEKLEPPDDAWEKVRERMIASGEWKD